MALDSARNILKVKGREHFKINKKVIILLPSIYVDTQTYLMSILSKKYYTINLLYRDKNQRITFLGKNYHKYKKTFKKNFPYSKKKK